MKRLIITLEYPPQVGGIASYVYNLAAHMPGDEVMVYAPKQKGDKEFDALNAWKVFRREPYAFFLWPRWVRLLIQILGICSKEHIDELYIHHVLPVGYVGWILKRLKKIPYTIFLHGTDVQMAMRTTWKRRQFRRVLKGAKRVVVNSTFLKNKVVEFIDASNIIVAHPCPGDTFFADVPEMSTEQLRNQLALSGKKVMLTVARMSEGKGYPHLLRILPAIVKAVPNAVWVVVGDGPKRDELVKTIIQYNLQNVVRFVGQVPTSQLPAYYHLADLFVLLTHPDETAEEGWGTAFLEAAACGVPVVAGRAGGVEEAVENLASGVVVDVHQEKAVVNAIVDLLHNPAYAREMGQKGKERAEREFRWEKQIEKLN